MKSREEIVAKKLYDLLSDHRLDTEQTGIYFAHQADPIAYDKMTDIVRSAMIEKQTRVKWLHKMVLGENNENYN